MANKQDILDNVDQYSADELALLIRQGVVTFDELCNDTDGMFSARQRTEVERILTQGEDDDWEKASTQNNAKAYQKYIDKYPDGKFFYEAQNRMAELKRKEEELKVQAEIKAEWDRTNKENLAELNDFVKKYPNSKYQKLAKDKIIAIQIGNITDLNISDLKQKIEEIETRGELNRHQKTNNILDEVKEFVSKKSTNKKAVIDEISNNNNFLGGDAIKKLIDEDVISIGELTDCGISKEIIECLFKPKTQHQFVTPDIERIKKQSTELYFWGIPSSGKSCALGGILSAAYNGNTIHTMKPDAECQGFDYMNTLMNLFDEDKVCRLLESTAINAFYEMGFDWITRNSVTYPITCIDMAGELMRCMYKYYAGRQLNSDEVKMLDTLHNILIDNKTTNRKMHFFVIEYGGENKEFEGHKQKVYLDGTVRYIEKTGLFKKDTDCVFVMITKIDKMKDPSKEKIHEYINKNYQGFFNGLETICKDNEINNGKVEIIPYTLGDVYFQNYCRFNPKPSENVIKIILEKAAGKGNSFWDKLINIFGH